MRVLFVLIFALTAANCLAQLRSPESVSVSYYGEMITHPGLKMSANYSIKDWEKDKRTKKGAQKIISKNLIVSPALGFYYHRRYQTGLFVIPEAKYKRQNEKGAFYELGIGLGYLRTFIPNTYEVNESADINKTAAGHNYFATNYFVSFGKDLSIKRNLPLAYFIRPQFMYAIPNFPKGTGYFALELGVTYRLKN